MSPSCIKDAKEFSPENSKIELFVYQVTKKRVWVRLRRSQDGGRNIQILASITINHNNPTQINDYMYQFSPWNCQLYILRIFFSIFFIIHQNHNVSLICVRCDPLHDIGIQDPQLLQGRFQGRIQRVFQGGRGGKNLGPNGDGVLGRKIFDFLTSLDAI